MGVLDKVTRGCDCEDFPVGVGLILAVLRDGMYHFAQCLACGVFAPSMGTYPDNARRSVINWNDNRLHDKDDISELKKVKYLSVRLHPDYAATIRKCCGPLSLVRRCNRYGSFLSVRCEGCLEVSSGASEEARKSTILAVNSWRSQHMTTTQGDRTTTVLWRAQAPHQLIEPTLDTPEPEPAPPKPPINNIVPEGYWS